MFSRRLVPLLLLVTCASLWGADPGSPSGSLSFRPVDPLNPSAFDHFYNLDYDRAIGDFEQILRRHPTDPFAVNHLLTGVLFKELYRMGSLNTADYSNDSFLATPHRPADPKVKAQIKDLVNRALKMEEERLDANPRDVDALYARGVTRAQYSTYMALMERAWFSALRNAVGARRDHERVLQLSPDYTDAKLVVGAHNYVMGSLPWALKPGAALIRLSGNKEKGLQYLRDAAAGSGESSVDAKILLALFLRREHQYGEALQIIRELAPKYPRDVLLALEEGNLLRAQGNDDQAAAQYRKVWQAGRDGHFPGLHYEQATLALGDLLRGRKDYSGAVAAYEQVSQVSDPDPEVLQKADLSAGEMYDLLQKRNLALQKYEAVVALNSSTPPADIARKRLKEAYRQD